MSKYKLKLSFTTIVLCILTIVFSGCKKSILIPEDKAITAPLFELQVIANEQEVNNNNIISLKELIKEPSVKAIILQFCLIDDITTGWVYNEVYEQNKSKGLISLIILNYYPIEVNQFDKDNNSFKFIHELINKTNINMPVLWDYNEEVRVLYNVSASPSIFLIDKSGKIRYSMAGYHEKFVKKLNQALEELLSLDTIKTSENIY